MASPAETLIASLEAATQWPVDPAWSIVTTHAAFREADTTALKLIAEWPSSRPYVPDPLPWLVAKAHADLLFGEEPEIEPANEADTELLDAITDASDIETQSHRAAQIASSEGEVWWHTYVDKVASDWPIIEFVSRSQVVCLWRGRTAAATAFVSVVRQTRADEVWRLLEVHETGRVLNLLFVGSSSRLGHAVDLGRMPELDLTASRRLLLAAKQSGVSLLLLRVDAMPMASAAETRWQVTAAPSRALAANAPGAPCFDVKLLRCRSRPAGQSWRLEWDRDRKLFRDAALPDAMVSVPFRKQIAKTGSGLLRQVA